MKSIGNELRKKREERNWSRESVSSMLYEIDILISDDRLGRIENDKAKVEPEEIWHLSRLYNSPELCYQYCQRVCEIGANSLPKVDSKNLPEIVMHIFLTLERIGDQDLSKVLMSITADGNIEEKEIPKLVRAQFLLEQLSLRVKGLQLNVERKLLNGTLDQMKYETEWKRLEEQWAKGYYISVDVPSALFE